MLDTSLDLEEKKRILLSYDVINEDGNIATPITGIDRPSDAHSSKFSDIKDIIEKMRDTLLKDDSQGPPL